MPPVIYVVLCIGFHNITYLVGVQLEIFQKAIDHYQQCEIFMEAAILKLQQGKRGQHSEITKGVDM